MISSFHLLIEYGRILGSMTYGGEIPDRDAINTFSDRYAQNVSGS